MKCVINKYLFIYFAVFCRCVRNIFLAAVGYHTRHTHSDPPPHQTPVALPMALVCELFALMGAHFKWICTIHLNMHPPWRRTSPTRHGRFWRNSGHLLPSLAYGKILTHTSLYVGPFSHNIVLHIVSVLGNFFYRQKWAMKLCTSFHAKVGGGKYFFKKKYTLFTIGVSGVAMDQ